jgi:hypothetical protein
MPEVSRPGAPGQDKAGLKKRKVKTAPVVRDEAIEAREHSGQSGDQRRLFVEVSQEVLGDNEGVSLEEPRADEKRIGAGPSGQPGGLGVKIEEAARIGGR